MPSFTPGEVPTASKMNQLMPPGAVLPYAGAAAPTGWLLCDGSLVNRTTYAKLFAVVGTTYGVGDGSTTFGLPDMRGRLPVGVGTHADVASRGLSDGAALASRRPKHLHTVVQPTFTGTAHSHTVNSHNHGGGDHTHPPGSGAADFWGGGFGAADVQAGGNFDIANMSTTGTSGQIIGAESPGTNGITATGTNSGGTVGPQTAAPTDAPAYLTLNYIIST